MKKNNKILIAMCLLICLFCGCGASANKGAYDSVTESFNGFYGSADIETDGYYDRVEAKPEKENSSTGTNSTLYEEKLVYTCNLEIQTLEFIDTVSSIKQKIQEHGGMIESEKEYDRDYDWYYSDKDSATMGTTIKVRIPSENYYTFLSSIDGYGKVISKSSNIENISKQYYEVSGIIEALEIQEDRLLVMMAECKTIAEMISVESRLTEVQTELNNYKNQLGLMDSKVAYSTITLQIDEVKKYSPTIVQDTFFDRFKEVVVETWEFFWELLEEILFFIIRIIPITIVLSPVIIFIILKIKKYKKKVKKTEKKE